MRRTTRLFGAVLALALAAGLPRPIRADHYDNQTPEEQPRKKKPLTKYEKSEYFSNVHEKSGSISNSPEAGRQYFYTEDGDFVDHGAKNKESQGKGEVKAKAKGKSKAKRHGKKRRTASRSRPKKQFKKAPIGEPKKSSRPEMPSSDAQDTQDSQAPSVHIMP